MRSSTPADRYLSSEARSHAGYCGWLSVGIDGDDDAFPERKGHHGQRYQVACNFTLPKISYFNSEESWLTFWKDFDDRVRIVSFDDYKWDHSRILYQLTDSPSRHVQPRFL